MYYTQFLKTQRRGLPAFRRLLGRPILQDVLLQDVVFAGGHNERVESHAAANRARVKKLSELNEHGKRMEKEDLKSVRKGCSFVLKGSQYGCGRPRVKVY